MRACAVQAPAQMGESGVGLGVIDVISQQALPALGCGLQLAFLLVERGQVGRGPPTRIAAFEREQESTG